MKYLFILNLVAASYCTWVGMTLFNRGEPVYAGILLALAAFNVVISIESIRKLKNK